MKTIGIYRLPLKLSIYKRRRVLFIKIRMDRLLSVVLLVNALIMPPLIGLIVKIPIPPDYIEKQ
jgi:hypothetical protein